MENPFQRKPSNQFFGQVLSIFGYLMIAVYAGAGLLLIFKGWSGISKTQAVVVGSLLLAYSVFRTYRAIKRKDTQEEDDD